MFTSSVDFLYFSLALVIILVGILLAIAIIYLIFILRDVSKTTYLLRDTLKQINDFVYRPIMIANSIVDKIGPIIEAAHRRGEEMMESSRAERDKKKKGKGKKSSKK